MGELKDIKTRLTHIENDIAKLLTHASRSPTKICSPIHAPPCQSHMYYRNDASSHHNYQHPSFYQRTFEPPYSYPPVDRYHDHSISGHSSYTSEPMPSASPLTSGAASELNTYVTTSMVAEAKAKANSSRTSFARNLVRKLFTEDVMEKSNISGINKDKLDPHKISEVKRVTMQMYPLEYGENEFLAWKKCHIAIDEGCRRLKKTKK